jgi:nicotinamidase-related amidase
MSDATYLEAGSREAGYPHGRTALLVIDPVNDFLSEGGAGWEMAKRTVELHDVVGNLRRVIARARENGIPVLFAPMAYTAEDYADRELQRRSGINRIMFERRMFQAGSWGADFHPDLRPQDKEIVTQPHKGVDVFQTDLPGHLQRLGITHLVIAGMTANLCCESTGRHAMEEGYDVTFLSDAIGADNLPGYEAAIHVNYPLIANAVLDTDEFLAVIDAGAAATAVEAGDTVRGSDRAEIGKVERVVEESDEVSAHVVVPRGLIFETDTYIPLDAITKRAGTTVFVNVPKLVIGKMGWDEPPLRSERQARIGAPRAHIDKLYGSRSPTESAP